MGKADQSPAKRARDLIRASAFASLSTLDATDGWPYGSLVMTACDHDAAPLLLISRLAAHTRNITADPRVALLFDHTIGFESRLAEARVTVFGRAEVTESETAHGRFCARHPNATDLLELDFTLYKIPFERAHLVGGFGDVHDIPGTDLAFDAGSCQDLIVHEAEVVAHMNTDHADALDLYANVLLDRPGKGWRMTGCDAEGCDLFFADTSARLSFTAPVHDPGEAREALVALAQEARKHV